MKPKLIDDKGEIESQDDEDIATTQPAPISPEDFDADEAEFRAIRRDLPGVKGSQRHRHRVDQCRQDAR